jgi:hypothetical protein
LILVEETMRRTMLSAAAALALLTAGSFLPDRAEAMTITAPVGLQAAIGDRLAQDAAYICRRVWRCGYYGCGWRRACYWGPGPYYGYGYGPRPYWGHRHWRRHW